MRIWCLKAVQITDKMSSNREIIILIVQILEEMEQYEDMIDIMKCGIEKDEISCRWLNDSQARRTARENQTRDHEFIPSPTTLLTQLREALQGTDCPN